VSTILSKRTDRDTWDRQPILQAYLFAERHKHIWFIASFAPRLRQGECASLRESPDSSLPRHSTVPAANTVHALAGVATESRPLRLSAPRLRQGECACTSPCTTPRTFRSGLRVSTQSPDSSLPRLQGGWEQARYTFRQSWLPLAPGSRWKPCKYEVRLTHTHNASVTVRPGGGW